MMTQPNARAGGESRAVGCDHVWFAVGRAGKHPTHTPDCSARLDGYDSDCTCGLTKPWQQRAVEPYGTAKARASTTDHLKLLWDSYDGAETSDIEISGEAVHKVLNERGEGRYCAV